METASMRSTNDAPIISLGEWLITLIITAIPLVGFIMLFVWAFGGNTNPTKANFAKASLIIVAIGIVLWFLFIGTLITAILSGGMSE